VTERISTTALSLPMGPHLTPAMQERVMEAVASFAG
jgi:dTDP-4-amino-4,6-dideoxygalactose transaminase